MTTENQTTTESGVDVPRLVMPLPCPFCGADPARYLDTHCGAPYPGGYFTIECQNDACPAEVNVCEKRKTDLKGMTHDEAEQVIWPEVIALWNFRHNV